MDRNYELAELLIETAEELLNESAGRNGVGDRYREARTKTLDKEILKFMHRNNPVDPEEDKKNFKKVEELYNKRSYVDGWKGNNNKSTPGNKFYGKAIGKNNYMGRQMAEYSKQISDGKAATGNDDTLIPPSKVSMFDGVGKYDRSDKKINPIHKKINDRAKSQNESIADLLIEAAELLSEYDD